MHPFLAATISLGVGAVVALSIGEAPRVALVGPAPHHVLLRVTASQLAAQSRQVDVAAASVAAAQRRARTLENKAVQLHDQTLNQENGL